jgi:alkyl sulfatase BDS1-like metallo-beta-lactamase superfamily hydrolase
MYRLGRLARWLEATFGSVAFRGRGGGQGRGLPGRRGSPLRCQLLKHAVFADPDHNQAKELLAQAFERLGHGAENGTWRNFYLMGATELREGIGPAPVPDLGAGMAAALTVEQLFDSVAIRVNGPKAWSEHLTIDWHFTDLGERYRMALSNGVLVHADPRRH